METYDNAPDLTTSSPICESLVGTVEQICEIQRSLAFPSPPIWPFTPLPEVSPVDSEVSFVLPVMPSGPCSPCFSETETFVEETPGIWDLEARWMAGAGDCKAGSQGTGGWTGKPLTGLEEMLKILLPRYFEL